MVGSIKAVKQGHRLEQVLSGYLKMAHTPLSVIPAESGFFEGLAPRRSPGWRCKGILRELLSI